MKEPKYDYIINAGPAKDNLRPCCSYKYKEDAIEAANRLKAERLPHFKYIEVVYMPEDNDDINEVVFTTYWRK